jgi:hypothetical protein
MANNKIKKEKDMNEGHKTTVSRSSIFKKNKFSRNQLIIFAVLFAIIGGYVLWKSFAASPLIATMQGEAMTKASGASIISDSTASGGQALMEPTNGYSSGTVNLPADATSVSMAVKVPTCNAGYTYAWLFIDGLDSSHKIFGPTLVNKTSFYMLNATVNLKAGSHTVTTYVSNAIKGSSCSSTRALVTDYIGFYGNATVTAPTQKPSTPTGLTATASGTSVSLKWSANPSSEGVDNYQVYWGTDSSFARFTYVPSVTSTSYSLSNLTSGTTYYFRISAHNAYGYGPWTNVVSSAAATASTGGGGGGGGGSTGGSTGVTPPTPPSAYTIPAGAVAVSSVSGLSSALSGSTRDIILENGTYSNGSSMLIGTHRLWARSLGGATLNFGLQIGGNGSASGGEVHGLRFDITNAAATADKAAIQIWGSGAGQNSGVFDSWINGHSVLTFGIEDRVTSGFKAQRLIMNNFTSYGVFFETYYPNYYTDSPAVVPVVSDIDVSNIARSPAGSSNGTAEAGIWAGTNCLCSNIKVRGAGWMGLWLGGNANNGTYSNFDIDNSGSYGAGVYLEHYSRNNLFKNFVIGQSSNGAGIKVGFNCEWADPAYAGSNPVSGQSVAGCHFNTIQDGTIYSYYRGIQLEDAEKTTIQRIKFIGQSNAAIGDFMTSGTGYSTIWQNLGNDFSGLKPGAVQLTKAH